MSNIQDYSVSSIGKPVLLELENPYLLQGQDLILLDELGKQK